MVFFGGGGGLKRYHASGTQFGTNCPTEMTVPVTTLTLLVSNSNGAQEIITSPQFVLLLRDDTPHVPNEDLGEEKVLNIISNLTHILNQVFPSKWWKEHWKCLIRSIL